MVGISFRPDKHAVGKYRPGYSGQLFFCRFFIMAFSTPDLGERAKILYAGVTYILLMSIYSFNNNNNIHRWVANNNNNGDIKERHIKHFFHPALWTATITHSSSRGLTFAQLVSNSGQNWCSKGLVVNYFIICCGGSRVDADYILTKERISPRKSKNID